MKRFAIAMLVVATTVALPSPVAAVGTTCVYNPSTKTVTVVITGDIGAGIWRDAGGRILVDGAQCDGATVTNTDLIDVTGGAESQQLTIQLANKGFKPGATGEPGKSDEIEFTINLGAGSNDTVSIVGTDAVNKIDFGQNNSQFGIIRRANLNSAESNGVDSDVTLIAVEKIIVAANGGNDVIRARGKAGTGPDAFSVPLWVYGGEGDDVIKGGEAVDHLFGDSGKDKVWGFGDDDTITLNDGTGGDIGQGGDGGDIAYWDPGDTWTQ